ncbi:WhiB family transcriptional regulator [Nocardioides sp. NPDC101246]|uniref:WhiB family transcriptional regulator n=1 Tax=Nocardioides sp. NPDC101246 TaxID=3364336 RepID=UPI0037F39F56
MITPAWHRRAACAALARIEINIFFSGTSTDTAEALAVCATCPVREQCLADALATEMPSRAYYVRGGLTAEQRRELLVEQRKAG